MAAGRLLIPSWMPALDGDGAPIPNARVYFYTDETTTLAPVFSDEGMTTPLTNPVEANSSGRFPAIWASDANVYTWSVDAPYGPAGIPFTGTGLQVSQDSAILVLTGTEAAADQAAIDAAVAADALADIIALAASLPDTNPVVIANKADLDGSNITTAPDKAAFRASIGADQAGNVKWTRIATGGILQFISSWLQRQDATVEDFGAIGDGLADDTSAIQACVAAYGRAVFSPGKTYKYSAGLSFTAGGKAITTKAPSLIQRWLGTTSTSVLKYTGGTAAVSITAPSGEYIKDFLIQGVVLDLSGAANGTHGIELKTLGATSADGLAGVWVDNVMVLDAPGNAIKHTGIVFDVTYDRLSTYNPTRTSLDHVYIRGPGTSQTRFNDCWISNRSTGTWAYNTETADQLVIMGGTVAPYDGVTGANGVQAAGGLCLRGTSVEGMPGQTGTTGIQYKGSSGAVIEPSNALTFGTNIKIGDGGADAAVGWVINGGAGSFNVGGKGQVWITAGGQRTGTILSLGRAAGAPTVTNDRLGTDGVLDVSYLFAMNVTVDPNGALVVGYSSPPAGSQKLKVSGSAAISGETLVGYTTGTAPAGAQVLKVNGGGFVNGDMKVSSTVLLQNASAWTNLAGAGAGTITNAPHAGNPDRWFVVSDSSGNYACPFWSI